MALKFRHEQKKVSRDLAAKLLKDLNFNNRKLFRPHVWTLASEMSSGVFNLNPQPIVILEDHKRATLQLLDGQHRLHAAAEKAPVDGVPMMFCYVQGNDAEIKTLQNTIDSGKPRTTTDRGGFQGLGIPQGFLEKSCRLFNVCGQLKNDTDPSKGVYDWMDAPRASYSACKLFADAQAAQLLEAHRLASQHYKTEFAKHRVSKQYLAVAYLVALLNGVEIDDIQSFANEALNNKSVLSCKLQEVWRLGHPFEQAVMHGSNNSSGIQYLLMRDLLVAFLAGTLKSDFEPVLNIRGVHGTELADFNL
tara:strand:- start:4504 stop:5418 length:915 start_codon:yes stop_codon:yes gene_type:complete